MMNAQPARIRSSQELKANGLDDREKQFQKQRETRPAASHSSPRAQGERPESVVDGYIAATDLFAERPRSTSLNQVVTKLADSGLFKSKEFSSMLLRSAPLSSPGPRSCPSAGSAQACGAVISVLRRSLSITDCELPLRMEYADLPCLRARPCLVHGPDCPTHPVMVPASVPARGIPIWKRAAEIRSRITSWDNAGDDFEMKRSIRSR